MALAADSDCNNLPILKFGDLQIPFVTPSEHKRSISFMSIYRGQQLSLGTSTKQPPASKPPFRRISSELLHRGFPSTVRTNKLENGYRMSHAGSQAVFQRCCPWWVNWFLQIRPAFKAKLVDFYLEDGTSRLLEVPVVRKTLILHKDGNRGHNMAL